jgi:hypothetical protein
MLPFVSYFRFIMYILKGLVFIHKSDLIPNMF